MIGEKSQCNQILGHRRTQRAVCSDIGKVAKTCFGKRISHLSGSICPDAVHIIQLDGAVGRTVAVGGNSLAGQPVQSIPFLIRSVAELQFSKNEAQAGDPFPDIGIEIPDAILAPIMAPLNGAASGCGPANTRLAILI